MKQKIEIQNMQKEDINQAVNLWVKQHYLYCTGEDFPQYWSENTEEMRITLEEQIQSNNALVAKMDNRIVGFLGFFVFDFHCEKSVLCNITSHSAEEDSKEQIYLELYKHASKLWVEQNIFNHLWMFFHQDERLKSFLYDLGFGSHVVDAYSRPNKVNVMCECSYSIRLATLDDLMAMKLIVDESALYYEKEPLFLKREVVSFDKLRSLIERNNIFVVCDGDNIIGFMNVNRSEENDVEILSVINCGMINELGAYIKPEYRGKKVGVHLLDIIFKYCRENKMNLIHVSFETANPFANHFWRKYFTPTILSVRRTINKDANS